jgi:hypothetical protein
MFAFAGFAFDGETLSFHDPSNPEEEVVVSEDGELSVQGEPVLLNTRIQRLLEELFAETARLGELLDQASDHLEVLDGGVMSRLLRGAESEGDPESEIVQQLDSVRQLIDTARQMVPELAELDWLAAE